MDVRGFNLKYKSKTAADFEYTVDIWSSMKSHMNKGYKQMYSLPDEFIKLIEEEIVIDGQVFKPKFLLSEDDFRVEGHIMKNCMNTQFAQGLLYFYVSLRNNKKRINLQYRKGVLSQMYGKANTPVDPMYLPAVDILSTRFEKEPNLQAKRIKYDLIKKN